MDQRKRTLVRKVLSPIVGLGLLAGCATPRSIQARRNFYTTYNNTRENYLENKIEQSDNQTVSLRADDKGYSIRVGIKGEFSSPSEIPKEMAGGLKAYGYGLTALLDGDTWTRPFEGGGCMGRLAVFESLFPRGISIKEHDRIMRGKTRSIVARHSRSDPNTGHDAAVLQRGAYMDSDDVLELREKSSRIGRRLRWRYDTGAELQRVAGEVYQGVKNFGYAFASCFK